MGNANSGRRTKAEEWAHAEAAVVSYQDFLARRLYVEKKVAEMGLETFLEDRHNRWLYEKQIEFQQQLMLKKIPNKQEVSGIDGEPLVIKWES